MLDPVFR